MSNIKIAQIQTLSDSKYLLKKVTYEYKSGSGELKGRNKEVRDLISIHSAVAIL